MFCKVLGHFGHGHFGQDISAMDISAMDISALDISSTDVLAEKKNCILFYASADEMQSFTTLQD